MIVMLLVYIIESIVSIVRQNRFHRLILRLTSSLVCLIIGLYFTTHFKNVALPWHIETALCNVIFVEIGIIISPMVLTTYKEQKSTTLQNTILLIVFMAAAMSFAFLNGETSARTDEYGINYILYFLSSVCFSLAYLYAGSLIGDKIHAISYTGKNTLPILLWNKFPIILLQTIIGKFTLVLTKPDTALALIVAIIPALISISLCLLAGAIQKKILPITLGITKKH